MGSFSLTRAILTTKFGTPSMNSFVPDAIRNLRSQELPTYYRLNGAIYICEIDLFIKQKSMFPTIDSTAYIMSTEEGHVISAGASITYYDTNLNKILKSTSGFDMGKPYHGTSVLLSRDEKSESWEYTEHSQGQTTTYAGTTRMINKDTMENSVRRKDGTGVTDTGTRTRHN